MRTRALFVFLSMCFFGTNAFGQDADTTPPHPDGEKVLCQQCEGLVDLDKDGFYAFIGTATADSTGFTGDLDCDDGNKSVNPAVEEILGNTTDEDCDGVVRDYPMKESQFALFMKNEYKGKSPKQSLFLLEFDACDAGSQATPVTCTVDLVSGRFVPAEGYLFVDAFVNGTEIYRNHGESEDGREVVSKAQYSHYRPTVKASPTLTRKTVTTIARAEASAAVGTEAGLRQAGDENLQGQINTIVTANAGRDAAVNGLGERVNGQETALQKEIENRQDADLVEFNNRRDADSFLHTRITANESRSVLVEGGPSVMLIGRTPLQQVDQSGEPNGEMVRNAALSAGGFGLRIGLETQAGEVAAFGNVGFGGDGEGSGADTVYQIGLETLVGSSTLIGGFLAFGSSTDHASEVDASVLENGVFAGVSLNRDFMPGTGRITGYARAGVGYSWYATKGTDANGTIVVPGSGVTGLFQLGVNFGAGASR